ncbi:hypothetical protein IAT38_006414 [Cryptococcus sp. DSM 104549]
MLPTRSLSKKLPLFYTYAVDAPNILAKRLEVRPAHLKRIEEDKISGNYFFGRGFLPPPGSPLFQDPALPPGGQPMAGSILVMRAPSLDDMWKRVKEDVYWTAGVWDHDKVTVGEFVKVPGDDDE